MESHDKLFAQFKEKKMKLIYNLKHQLLDQIRFYYRGWTDNRVKMNLKRYKTASNKKDPSTIKREIQVLKSYWGYIPNQYYAHDFYSRNCKLSLEDMKKYIPPYYFYKIIFPQYDDVKKILPLVENKIEMNNLFKEVGLEQSSVFLVKEGTSITNFMGDIQEEREVTDTLSSLSNDKIFIKPVSGRGGKGILIAKKTEQGYELPETKVTYDFLKALTGDYVIEKSIEQLPYLNSVYPHSVNTIRAITCRDKDGHVSFIAATLRMGVGGSEIDNSSAGGILIGINLDNGKALKPYATYEYGLEQFPKHPDSGFDFSKLQLPNWAMVKADIEASAIKMTQINLAGWDIAITEQGIVVIEVNTLFGLDHTQAGVGGLKDFFVDGLPKNYSGNRD